MTEDEGAKRPARALKGRGATHNPANRYHSTHSEAVDDGWGSLDVPESSPQTRLAIDHSRSVVTYNASPDVPFDRSVNPYRGCEHGCCYCFARPTHAYLDLSPGLDFETRLFYKPDAPEQLRRELANPRYRCAPIALGINTDAYQPVERRVGLTRRLLEVLVETRHPVSIVTKSALVERDLDLLARLAEDGLVIVHLSLTTLDVDLVRRLEPRATAPARRVAAIRRLTAAGVPVGVLVAPVIPFINDAELERILEAARDAGALEADYILLRLPREVRTLFADWLAKHYPLKAERVMQRMHDSHGGKAYDATFGTRMRGTGIYAELIAQRFRRAYARLGFPGLPTLTTALFSPPRGETPQMSLF